MSKLLCGQAAVIGTCLINAIFASAFLVGAAHAQVGQDIIDATVGRYRLAQPGSSKACTITLTKQASIGGLRAIVPEACAKAFPALKDAGVWSFDGKGGLALRDTLGMTLVTFEEEEDASMEARRPGGVTWTLKALDAPRPLTPGEQMTGLWKVTGIGGEPVKCSLDFVSKDGKSGTAKPRRGCAKPYAGITNWTIARERMTAKDAAGKTIATFKRGDVATFEQMGTGEDSVYLSHFFD